MKMPTSSSVLLATLAISSSSSSLAVAAPIGDGTQDTGMTSSSSGSRISSFHGGSAPRAYPAEMDVQGRSETITGGTLAYPGRLETRDNPVDDVVKAIDGVLAGAKSMDVDEVVKAIGGVLAGVKSMDVDGTTSNINPQAMEALPSTIPEITSLVAANGTVPSQVMGIPGEVTTMLPNSSAPSGGSGGASGSSGSSNSAAPTETAAAAVAANDGATPDATSTASYSSPSASPSSPPLPGNPPNSPVNSSALPVDV